MNTIGWMGVGLMVGVLYVVCAWLASSFHWRFRHCTLWMQYRGWDTARMFYPNTEVEAWSFGWMWIVTIPFVVICYIFEAIVKLLCNIQNLFPLE